MKKIFFLILFSFRIIICAQNTNADTTNLDPYSEIPDFQSLQTKLDLKDAVAKADVLPEFPGGMASFKKRFFESLKSPNLKKRHNDDTRLYFIIEKTGYIKNFIAIGTDKNNIKEAETALKGVFERWKPAQINNQNVRYLVYFPIQEYRSELQKQTIAKDSASLRLDPLEVPDFEEIKTKIDFREAFNKADLPAEFPGGMKNFRKRFFESLKPTNSKKESKNDTRLYFIVEKSGYVKNFAATGSNKNNTKDAEIAMKGVFERWKPAQINQQNVRYLMYFPIEELRSEWEKQNLFESNTDLVLSSSEIPDLDVLKSKIDLKDVALTVDEKPEFQGGIEAFKRKYFETIEILDLKANEKIDTKIYFVVEKNGYVRNIAAIGSNKEHIAAAELAVKRITNRWSPAKKNGKPVRYILYFFLTNKKY